METINTQYVFSEKNQVSIKTNDNNNEWYPINFQWIPIKKLNENMNQ